MFISSIAWLRNETRESLTCIPWFFKNKGLGEGGGRGGKADMVIFQDLLPYFNYEIGEIKLG